MTFKLEENLNLPPERRFVYFLDYREETKDGFAALSRAPRG